MFGFAIVRNENDSAKLQGAQDQAEGRDEELSLKSEALNYGNHSEIPDFPSPLQTLKYNAKPCPHCRTRGRDVEGNLCVACEGTGETNPKQGTT